jgi:hypothetical protein
MTASTCIMANASVPALQDARGGVIGTMEVTARITSAASSTALSVRLKTTHSVEVDFKPSDPSRRSFRLARRTAGGEPFNPTLLAGIAGKPNRAAHRCSKRL